MFIHMRYRGVRLFTASQTLDKKGLNTQPLKTTILADGKEV